MSVQNHTHCTVDLSAIEWGTTQGLTTTKLINSSNKAPWGYGVFSISQNYVAYHVWPMGNTHLWLFALVMTFLFLYLDIDLFSPSSLALIQTPAYSFYDG
jgi:hypothetical protein